MPRVLRNFLIVYLLLHLLAAGVVVLGLTRSVRSLMIDNARQQMRAMASMLDQHIVELEDTIRDPSLPEHIKRLGEETQFRFSVIDKNGIVIADSETGTRDIGPHGDRPEILAATRKKPGFSERESLTLKIPMMYLAIPHSSTDKPEGFIRVATPSLPINEAIRSAQTYFWTFSIGLGILAGLLMTMFAYMSMKPLGTFADAARRIGVGEFVSFPSMLSRNDEWRSLATAFRTMQSEMANREQRVIKNRDRLQAVLSSMLEGVVSVSSDRKVLIANRAACQMLGITETEIRGKQFLEVVRDPELAAAIEKTQSEKTFTKTEFQITKDMNRRTISARASVLPNQTPDENEVPGVVIVLNDITAIQQLENMRRDFVANVSHELKTPLSSIKAYAETLKLGAINDKERNIAFVERIEEQAEFLNKQIQDLLQIARIESGREVWDIQPVDLNREIENCLSQFSKLADDGEIELKTELSDEQPMARADVEGITTILNNLVANALSYTPNGGVVVVTTSYVANSAVIEVADTGIGIAPEHQARVFERFYRVDKARSRDKGGTGLGLSIVKHLAQSFGGSVEIESELGQGSTFRIRLPKFVK